MFVLFSVIIGFAIGCIDGMLGGSGNMVMIYDLFIIVPSITVGIRRMHDTDHSGWFLLIPIYNFILTVQEGHSADNRFGSDPKAASVSEPPIQFPVATGSQSQDFDQQLRILAKLKEDGIISKEEFEQKKKAILGI